MVASLVNDDLTLGMKVEIKEIQTLHIFDAARGQEELDRLRTMRDQQTQCSKGDKQMTKDGPPCSGPSFVYIGVTQLRWKG